MVGEEETVGNIDGREDTVGYEVVVGGVVTFASNLVSNSLELAKLLSNFPSIAPILPIKAIVKMW